MLKPSLLLTATILAAAPVFAQELPPPAPIPGEAPAPKPKAAPQPTPKATAPAEIPYWKEIPSQESPITIGDPVRKTPTKAKPSVAGVDIAGLNDAAAVKKLRSGLESKLKAPVRIIAGEYQYTFLRDELGAEIPYWPLMRQAREKGADVPLVFQVNEKTAIESLRELDSLVREDQRDLALNVGGTLVRVKIGLGKAPISSAIESLTIAAPPEAPAPKPAAQVVKATPSANATNKKYPYLLANFSTRYNAALRGRTTNLKMAAKNINGTVVAPGKTFSTNLSIGPRNASAGWKEAQMFVAGKVVSGTGAGICQAASTLYNAALLANLPIVERHNHMFRVSYVPASRDAAIYWGGKDFRFRNDSGAPIYVETSVSGGKFHAKIWGAAPRTKEKVTIESQVLSRKGGATRSTAYKVVGDQKIRLSSDYYRPHP